MAPSAKDQQIFEFFKTVLKSHVDKTGKLHFDKLGEILISLGRKISEERILKIRKKFDTKETGMIDYKDTEFLMTIASINVVDVKAIDDKIYSTAFRIFDRVNIIQPLKTWERRFNKTFSKILTSTFFEGGFYQNKRIFFAITIKAEFVC